MQLQDRNTSSSWSLAVDYAMFAGIALMWSSSFLFIKIAVEDVTPLTITAGRIAIAAILLYLYLRARGEKLPSGWSEWGQFAFIGVVGNILPFFLIGYGEQSVPSGLAAILMGIMPIATIMLAHVLIPDEPFDLRKGAGVLLGFGGVLMLVGLDALAGFGASTLGQLSVLGGALCYAVNTVFVRRHVTLGGPVMAAGSQIAGAVMVVPLFLMIDAPWRMQPTTASLASILVLGLFSTALATLFYFRLVRNLGAGKLAQVNYLIPVLGASWGMMFLGERLEPTTFGALAMVLAGVAIVSGRRKPAAESQTEAA